MVEELINKRIAMWGVGDYLRQNIKYLDDFMNIVCFIDKDKVKQGTCPLSDGRKCVDIADLRQYKIDFIVVSVKKKDYLAEIMEQIEMMGIEYTLLDDILQEYIWLWDAEQVKRFDEENPDIFEDDGRIARYIDCNMIKQVCNLRCSYCYVAQARSYGEKITPFTHSVDYMVRALSPKRCGGICFIDISAEGEPLLKPGMVDFMRGLLESGHYIRLTTNGTITDKMEEINSFPGELLDRLLIRFSYHFIELKKKNMLELFFDNICKFRESGGSIMLFMIADEEYLAYKDEIKELSMKYLKALPQLDMVRNENDERGGYYLGEASDVKRYLEKWEEFDSGVMAVRMNYCRDKVEVECNVGKTATHVNLMSGYMSGCSGYGIVDNIYDDVLRPIRFSSNSKQCPFSCCTNGITYLTIGAAPAYNVPTFYNMANRIDSDGVAWITPKMGSFLNQKLPT